MSLAVCVCGWYLEQFDQLYRALFKLNRFRGVPVHVVSHRESDFLDLMSLPHTVGENRGLEFGAYDLYLKKVWDRESNVVFMHDDIELRPVITRDFRVPPEDAAWEVFKTAQYDHAYVFRDRGEDVVNDGKHGRMFFASKRLLEFYLEKGGFPFDEKNEGHTEHDRSRPDGVKPFNYAVNFFDMMLDEAAGRGMKVRQPVYLPQFAPCHRGERGKMVLREGRIEAVNP